MIGIFIQKSMGGPNPKGYSHSKEGKYIMTTVRTEGLFVPVPPSGVTPDGIDWNVSPGEIILEKEQPSDSVIDTYIRVAKTWQGAARFGFPTIRCCTVSVNIKDIVQEDKDALLTKSLIVDEWYDAVDMIRTGIYGLNNFIGADLRKANLSGTKIFEADFWKADLGRVNFRESSLANADFSLADLYGADFTMATLSKAKFHRALLTKADFYNADLSETKFYGATLRNANFSGAYLKGSNFTESDLSEANFRNVDLTNVNLGEWEVNSNGYAQLKRF